MNTPDPSPPEPALQAAARLLAEGRPAEAAEMLGRIVAQTPIYAAAHVLRATALEAAGLVDAALVSWGRAAALVPRSPLVHRERERLLAVRLADEPPLDLPPAEPAAPPTPEPPAAPAPLAEAPDEPEPQAAAPDPPTPAPAPPGAAPAPPDPYATPRPLDVSDLVFTDAPPAPPAGRADPRPEPATEPPADEPDSEAERAPAPPPADWAAVPPAQATILPPEGAAPAPPPPPPDEDEEFGWGVLDESDVPTPPPGAYAEPDVVAPEPPGSTVADDLDDLISQLEVAPRIRPDPEFDGPDVPLDAGDVDDLASETLAKIYAAQHQYVEAALVYEKLAAQKPDQADELLERAAELRRKR